MSRAWALLVIVAVLALSAAPFTAAAHRAVGEAGESCPMMMHQVNPEPCIGVPCPCDHGTHDSVLPAGPLGMPLARRQLTPQQVRTPRTNSSDEAARDGFPIVSERPPCVNA